VPTPDPSHVAGLAEWIGALRAELRRAQDAASGEDIRFLVGPVELELEIVSTREADGSGQIRFWVLSAGASARVGRESTQRITMTLTPESPSGPLKVGDRLDRPPR
jgi:Trypsin-co-occurring domain 2